MGSVVLQGEAACVSRTNVLLQTHVLTDGVVPFSAVLTETTGLKLQLNSHRLPVLL